MKKNRIKLSMFVLSVVGLSVCLSGCVTTAVVATVAIIAHATSDNYTATAMVPKPANEVYTTAKKVIQGQPGVRIVKQNVKTFHIEAEKKSVKVSVKIDIKTIDAKSCKVKVAAYGDQTKPEAKALTNRVFNLLCDRLDVKHTLVEK
jgi:hypothetical protein